MVIKASRSKSVVRGLGLALLASTAFTAWSGQAAAQTAPSTPPSTAPATTASAAQTGQNVETVIVTAEKRAERLIDVPTSISVVTAADIQDKTMIQLSDIAIQVPNVQFQGSSLFPNIAIRGVGSPSGTQTGVDPAAVVYVDGVYQGRERAENIPLAGIQQVEVLRGPQGTLYGENTIGGAINITTVKPDGEERAEGDIMFGNLGYVQTSAFVTGALTDDLFVAATGTYRNRDGFIHNDYDNSNLNYDRDMAGRLRFVWNATSHLSFDVSADYLHENDSESLLTTSYSYPYYPLLFPNLPPIQKDSRTEDVNSPEFGRREVYGGSVHAAYDFSGARLDSITSYRGYTSSYGFDSDGTDLSLDSENDLDNANLFTQELRLTSTEAGPFQWILGAYYSHQRLVDAFDNVFYSGIANLFGLPVGSNYADTGTTTGRIISNEYALFANATYEITPRWKIDAGFRYSIDQKNLTYSQVESSLVGGPSLICSLLECIPYANPHLDERVPTGDISLSYKVDDDQTAYVKFSRGYKAGGFNAYLNTAPFNQATDFKFQPEYLNNYELGYKSSWWNGFLTFNGDVFYDDYTNKQEVIETVVPPSLGVANAAAATIYGAELESDIHPVDGLTLSGTLGYLQTRYGTFKDGTASYAGNSLPGAPQLQATLAGQYEHELPGWDGWAGMIRLEGIHQSHSFTDPENTPSLINKPVSYLNGRIGVDNGTFGFFLWGNNLTGTYALSGGLNELVAVARAVNLPTTYGGEITFKF
jgi:iron complex outermembrane receptor protein